MNRLGGWMRMLFHRGRDPEVPVMEPLPSIVTPDRVEHLETAKAQSASLDKRFIEIGRVLADYQAQDGVLSRRQR